MITKEQERILEFLKRDSIGRKNISLSLYNSIDLTQEERKSLPVLMNEVLLAEDDTLFYYDKKSGQHWHEGNGPIDSHSRDFCVEMIALGKFFTRNDIALLSTYLGYDCFDYAGSYGCRHTWKVASKKSKKSKGRLPIKRLADTQDI